MADDAGDKTEPPTPRRRTETRERGQVPKSADFSSALLLLGGMLCIRWFAPGMITSLIKVLRDHLVVRDPSELADLNIGAAVTSLAVFALAAAGPVLLGLVLLALLGTLAQVGLLFTFYPLRPKLDKLNPINGLKRLFSVKTFVQLAMNLVKLAVVCAVAHSAISSRKGAIFLAMEVRGWHQIAVMTQVLFDIGVQLAAALLVLAVLDLIWQRWKHERDMKMTKQEVKEEMRRMEGDPLIRKRRLQMQFTALLQRIKAGVPTADVVVTNPTEFAIAIKYDVETMRAPKVVAKGQNLLARKIREIAIQHRIPIVERPPLAQALYRMVDIGQEVPEHLYKAIAEILAYVYELSGRTPSAKPASAA